MAGPRTRQKLQPRSEQALVNTFRSHYADRDTVGQPSLHNHRVNKFRDERNVSGDISNRTMHRDFSTFDTLQGNRVNQPGGRTSKLLIHDNQGGGDIDYYLRHIGTGGSGYEQHGVGGEQIPVQLTGGGQDYWHTEDRRNMLTAMNENSNFVQRPEFDMNQPSTWNRGGSVNLFEETRQAAQDWSPREQYISRSNQPPRAAQKVPSRGVEGINWRNYIGPDIRVGGGSEIGNIERANTNTQWRMPSGPGEGFIQRPGRPEEGRGGIGPDSFWNVKANQLDNEGIMTADAGNIMNKYKQFTDTFGDFDIGRDGIEYEKDFDVPFGGTGTFEGWGGDDDYGVGINFNWPLGQSAALDDRGGNWLSRIGGALKDEFGGSAMAGELMDMRDLKAQEKFSAEELRNLRLSGSDLGALADEDHTLGIEPPTYPSKWKPWTWFNRGGIASLR